MRIPRTAPALFAALLFLTLASPAFSQDSKVMGEVRFEGATKLERDSGVWIDGNYVGYLKELKGNKKVLLTYDICPVPWPLRVCHQEHASGCKRRHALGERVSKLEQEGGVVNMARTASQAR